MKKYGLTKKAYEIGMFKFLALSKEQVEDFSSFEKEEAILKIKQLHPELSDNEIEKQLGIFTLQVLNFSLRFEGLPNILLNSAVPS